MRCEICKCDVADFGCFRCGTGDFADDTPVITLNAPDALKVILDDPDEPWKRRLQELRGMPKAVRRKEVYQLIEETK